MKSPPADLINSELLGLEILLYLLSSPGEPLDRSRSQEKGVWGHFQSIFLYSLEKFRKYRLLSLEIFRFLSLSFIAQRKS